MYSLQEGNCIVVVLTIKETAQHSSTAWATVSPRLVAAAVKSAWSVWHYSLSNSKQWDLVSSSSSLLSTAAAVPPAEVDGYLQAGEEGCWSCKPMVLVVVDMVQARSQVYKTYIYYSTVHEHGPIEFLLLSFK